MSGFANSILGGASNLIRKAIQSPNFITGISGWSINKDGSAEFANLTLRGTFVGIDYTINSSGLFFYSGPPAPANFLTGQNAGFDGGNGTWTGTGNTNITNVASPVHGGTGAMAMTSAAAGDISAAHCTTASILANGLPCSPGDIISGYAWLRAKTVARSCQMGAQFYTAAGVSISILVDAPIADSTTAYTLVTGNVTAPATAAFCRRYVKVAATGGAGETHFADDVFIANRAVTPGNLIASVSAAQGFDAAGNAYLAEITSYNGPFASQIDSGGASFLQAPSQAGPWTATGNINGGVPSGFAGLVIQGQNGAQFPSLDILSDGIGSWVMPQAGTLLVAQNPSTILPETWHAMTLINGWAAFAAPAVKAQYRLVASPPNSVEIIGTINAAAHTSTVFAVLPAAYRPVSQQSACAAGTTGGTAEPNTAYVQCDTSGNLSALGWPSGLASFQFHGFISLDA